jgi:hypothetical protein
MLGIRIWQGIKDSQKLSSAYKEVRERQKSVDIVLIYKMALRDQPYLPLFIQDFLTDEKLAQCSAKANGVYIRIMCIMHKSDQYGKILLKQKHKQSTEQVKNFASQLVKHLPYDFHTVTESLVELLDEKVLIMVGDILIQKRMVKDNEISELRSKAGKNGGKKTQKKSHDSANGFASTFAKAKNKASPEYEYENEIEDENGSFEKSEKLFCELSDLEITNTIEYLVRTAQKQLTSHDMRELFAGFKIQYHKDYYPNRNKVIQHFRNWSKQQNRNQDGKKSSSGTSQHDQLNQVYASVKQSVAEAK